MIPRSLRRPVDKNNLKLWLEVKIWYYQPVYHVTLFSIVFRIVFHYGIRVYTITMVYLKAY